LFSVSTHSADVTFSPANELLFNSDHLANISEPSTLVYDFVKDSSLDEGFSDTVEAKIVEGSSHGAKNVELRFFTGERRRYVPPVSDALGNPIIMAFLQYDAHGMSQLTQGSWRHFQNRIKQAFAEDAVIRPINLNFKRKDIKGTEVTIYPYVNDPQRHRFENLAGKFYVFSLSEDVPGTIFQIRTIVPSVNATKSEEPLVQEVLTFRKRLK
jgi:hypothetical protein